MECDHQPFFREVSWFLLMHFPLRSRATSTAFSLRNSKETYRSGFTNASTSQPNIASLLSMLTA